MSKTRQRPVGPLPNARRAPRVGAWVLLVASAWILLVAACGTPDQESYISEVVPARIPFNQTRRVELRGKGLYGSISMQLDDTRKPDVDRTWAVSIGPRAFSVDQVEYVDSSTLSISVAAGLAVGTYDLTVTGPGGQRYFLPNALKVEALDDSAATGGTATGGTGGTATGGTAAGGTAAGGAAAGGAGSSSAGMESDAGATQTDRDAGGPPIDMTDSGTTPDVPDDSVEDAGAPVLDASVQDVPDAGRGVDDSGTVPWEDGAAPSANAMDAAVASDAGEARVCVGRAAACRPCAVFPEPELLTGLGVDGALFGPTMANNNRYLFFSAEADGGSIWWADRVARSTTFLSATASVLNDEGPAGSPTLTANGLNLYFDLEAAGGLGGRDVWFGERVSIASFFDTPTLLGGVNSANDDYDPEVTGDELTLVFTSNRPGGEGGTDLWISDRPDLGQPFAAPSNLVELNTPDNETGPAISEDGLVLYFTSDRDGDDDIWVAARADRFSEFGSAEPLTELNSPFADQDLALTPGGLEVFFSSDRSGEHQLWRSLRTCH